MLLVVFVVALWMGYVVNFTQNGSVCLVAVDLPPNWLSEAQIAEADRDTAEPRSAAESDLRETRELTISFATSQEMISSVIVEARDLSVLRDQESPQAWLGERIKVDTVQDSSILCIQLIRYPYLDRDNAGDYPRIMKAILRVLEEKLAKDAAITVLQQPTEAQ